MTVQLQRDPFARATFVRELVPTSERHDCNWCGQPARFRYGWEEDSFSRRDYLFPDQYCGVGCFRIYNS